MSSRVCWKCETKAHMSPQGALHAQTLGTNHVLQKAFLCDECQFLSIGVAIRDVRTPFTARLDSAVWFDSLTTLAWFPTHAEGRDFLHSPADIAGPASEAYKCRSVDCFRSAVLMARAVIEATAKNKGITMGRLVDKIDKLYEERFIREHIRDAAHEIRHLGNDMAHGDFAEEVSAEDADEILTLMAEVLEEVFESPARVAQRRAARLAKT